MTQTIWLITEGGSEKPILEAILRGKDMAHLVISPLTPTDRAMGLTKMATQLDKLILTAKQKKQPQDCILVLHDADENRPENQRAIEGIRQICKQDKDVAHVIARNTIESWLLADNGLCQWLGIKPKNCDEKPNPKNELEQKIQKRHHKMRWRGPDQAKVLKHVDGTGDRLSPSMKKAATLLCKDE